MRACIFCGEPATTKEHVFPAWLMRAVADRTKTAHMVLTLGFEQKRPFVQRGAGLGISVRHLCSECNNVRLSQLETPAKTYLLPMLRDVAMPLDSDAQAIIAAWMVKTVMVCECIARDRAWYSDDERRNFLSTLEPPKRTAVWIGRSTHSGWSLSVSRKVAFGKGWPFKDGIVATFAIDHLVFQVVAVTLQAGHHYNGTVTFKSTNVVDPWAQRLFQCWPTRPGAPIWPPALPATANEEDVEMLARRFEMEPAPVPE